MENDLYSINLSYEITTKMNNFCVFKSIEDISYLVYYNHDIISYNLNDIKIQNKIIINSFYYMRYFFDKANKRDLILISSYPSILIFNFNTLECFFSMALKGRLLYGCPFFDNNNNIYLYAQIYLYDRYEDEIIDLKRKKTKKFSKEIILFSDSYYDDFKDESFIIFGTENNIKSYICCSNNLKIYHEYTDGKSDRHVSAIIKKEKEITKLFDASYDGYIRIWNFHTGELLSKILIHKNFRVFDFDLLDDNYIICGCSKNTIELFNIETKQFIQKLIGYFMDPFYLKIISIPNGTKYFIMKCTNIGIGSKLQIFTISKKKNN